MRRVAGVVIGAGALVFGMAIPAAADPAPPSTVCSINDLGNLSGLVATANGYVVINGIASGQDNSNEHIYVLDGACKREKTVNYQSQSLDPEDIAVQSDGTLWIGDIGDTSGNRPTVALWKVAGNGTWKMTRYRFTYPDNAHHDAEALIVNGDGMPIIVTKSASGPAELYTPAAAPDSNASNGVPLKKVGEFHPVRTNTPNQFGVVGQNTVTGGANSPDGKRVVLRTYSDAYEWDVTNGDVVAAITQGKPRITQLPNESRGEAIAYTHDGSAFLTVPRDGAAKILKYTPSTSDKPPATKAPVAPGSSTGSFLKKLTLKQLTYMVAGAGLLGLLMVIGGIAGIRYARAHPSAATDSDDAGVPPRRRRRGARDDDWPDDAGVDGPDVAAGRVYGTSGSTRGGAYSGAGYPEPGYDPGYDEPAPRRHPRQRYDSGNPEPGYREPGYREPDYPEPRRPRGRAYRGDPSGGPDSGYDEPYADRYR